jgi:hypothetical protein
MKETIEEAAERLLKGKYGIFISKDADVKGQLVIDTANAAFLSGMNEGARWQQEQILQFLYSEIAERRPYSSSRMCEEVIKFIEQNKNND